MFSLLKEKNNPAIRDTLLGDAAIESRAAENTLFKKDLLAAAVFRAATDLILALIAKTKKND